MRLIRPGVHMIQGKGFHLCLNLCLSSRISLRAIAETSRHMSRKPIQNTRKYLSGFETLLSLDYLDRSLPYFRELLFQIKSILQKALQCWNRVSLWCGHRWVYCWACFQSTFLSICQSSLNIEQVESWCWSKWGIPSLKILYSEFLSLFRWRWI